MAHNHVIAGSTPVLQQLSYLVGTAGFVSLNKLSNKDKAGMSLICIRHCDYTFV